MMNGILRFSPKGDKIVYAAKPGESWDLFEV